MSNKILYFISAVCATFPVLFIYRLDWWISLILILIILAVQLFSPLLSTIIQGVSWITGFVFFFIFSYPLIIYIIAIFAFVYWLVNQIFFYSMNRINRNRY